jgi:predicted nucleic acid-binding protein
VPVVDFTAEVARVHAELLATLMTQGQLIGAHDLLIAATARHRQSAVLTTNTHEFQRVPDLEVIPFRDS